MSELPEQNPRRRRIVRLLMILAGAVVVCAAMLPHLIRVYRFGQFPVSSSGLAQLHVGMPAAEVQVLFGKPTFEQENGTWVYSKRDVWAVLYISFDAEHRLQSYHLDE